MKKIMMPFHKQNLTVDEVKALAKEKGLVAELGCERKELLIDCDSKKDFDTTINMLQWVNKMGILPVTKILYTRSKSNHWHVYATVDKMLGIEEKVLLQAVLGGDKKRAMYDWLRFHLTCQNLSALFEKPDTEFTEIPVDKYVDGFEYKIY